MPLTRLILLASLGCLPSTGPQAAAPCTPPHAAIAYLLDRQEELDELHAGGHGPLRIAYLHAPGDAHARVLASLATREGFELAAYRVRHHPAELAPTAQQAVRWQPVWVLVASEPVWHGAILAELSRKGIAAAKVIRLERAARNRNCPMSRPRP